MTTGLDQYLVTDVPSLDPLAKLEITLAEVQPTGLEQNFSLHLAVSWERESVQSTFRIKSPFREISCSKKSIIFWYLVEATSYLFILKCFVPFSLKILA